MKVVLKDESGFLKDESGSGPGGGINPPDTSVSSSSPSHSRPRCLGMGHGEARKVAAPEELPRS